MCLPTLPGHAPRGTKDRAGQARLGLAELDAALGAFLVGVYNLTPHSETGTPPQERWEAGAFLPRMPECLEELDLLLLTVATARKVHPDGIHFQGLRYLDATLAAYVGEAVTLRYDPRDMAEIRVFHHEAFVCRAICPELADATVSLKEIIAARTARRRGLRQQLAVRTSVVDQLLALRATTAPAPRSEPVPPPVRHHLKLYREEADPADVRPAATHSQPDR